MTDIACTRTNAILYGWVSEGGDDPLSRITPNVTLFGKMVVVCVVE